MVTLNVLRETAKDLTIANFLECRGRSNYEVYSWIYKNSLGDRFLELAGCIASYQEVTTILQAFFLRNVAALGLPCFETA